MSKERARSVDSLIARVAASQYGVITLEQLRASGVDSDAISYRLRIGRLYRRHRGIYAVGHPSLSDEGLWMAAVLACGPGAVLSHRPAAVLWRLLSRARGPVDVTVRGDGGRRPRQGIRLHRSATLTQQETTRRLNIPVTNPARTLTDLRGCVSPDEWSRARRQAEFFGYQVDAAIPKSTEMTRSELERHFLRLCLRHHLPAPLVNAPLCGYEVDFLWSGAKLVVETDGYDAHSGRESFEYDHRRQAKLSPPASRWCASRGAR